jgi:hypothetical protein
MHKSKAHYRVRHNGLTTAVPISYLAIYHTRVNEEQYKFGTINGVLAKKEAALFALAETLNRKVWGYENPIVDTTQVITEDGDEITDQMFTVHEHSSGFSLTHNPSGETHWLSDGVDTIGFDNDVLSSGSIGFAALWTEIMNDDTETLEAYFPGEIDE